MLNTVLEFQLEAFLDSHVSRIRKLQIRFSWAIFAVSGYKLTEQLINTSMLWEEIFIRKSSVAISASMPTHQSTQVQQQVCLARAASLTLFPAAGKAFGAI